MKTKDGVVNLVRTTEDAGDLTLPHVFGGRRNVFVLLLGPRNRVIGVPAVCSSGFPHGVGKGRLILGRAAYDGVGEEYEAFGQMISDNVI